jgi:hypothetical protein
MLYAKTVEMLDASVINIASLSMLLIPRTTNKYRFIIPDDRIISKHTRSREVNASHCKVRSTRAIRSSSNKYENALAW